MSRFMHYDPVNAIAPLEHFHVERDLSGRIRIECPSLMLVQREVAITMGRALLQIAGDELIHTEPGLTVTRRNGNGIVR